MALLTVSPNRGFASPLCVASSCKTDRRPWSWRSRKCRFSRNWMPPFRAETAAAACSNNDSVRRTIICCGCSPEPSCLSEHVPWRAPAENTARLPGSMMVVPDWVPLRHSLAITDRTCNRSRWDVCWWAPDEDGPIWRIRVKPFQFPIFWDVSPIAAFLMRTPPRQLLFYCSAWSVRNTVPRATEAQLCVGNISRCVWTAYLFSPRATAAASLID